MIEIHNKDHCARQEALGLQNHDNLITLVIKMYLSSSDLITLIKKENADLLR